MYNKKHSALIILYICYASRESEIFALIPSRNLEKIQNILRINALLITNE